MPPSSRLAGLLVVSVLFASACGSDSSTVDATTESSEGSNGSVKTVDPEAFFAGALTEDATTTDCTLASGTETSCYELTIAGFPATRDEIGPWCPKTTSDTAEDAGIWFDGEAVYDVDGPVNLCVYGEIEWTESGGAVPSTVEIPITPTLADEHTSVGTTVGVTLGGVTIDGSAPIDLILGNYAIGVFDDCGGQAVTAKCGSMGRRCEESEHERIRMSRPRGRRAPTPDLDVHG